MELLIQYITTLLIALAGWLGGFIDTQDPSSTVATTTAQVLYVVDGDTIKVAINGTEETVRYIGIDTPEPYREGQPECFSDEAADHNRSLVEGREVVLESDAENRDRYDRLLRYVYVDGLHVNEQLVAQGYATTLSIAPNTTYRERFATAERAAKETQLGLWGACAAPQATTQPVIAPTTADEVSIQVDTLPAGQQRALETFGVETDTIEITPDMIECANNAVGSDRMQDVINGDTPSMLEGAKLLLCL